ncbi:MAG TPA: hypothetical protein VKR59_15125 [Terriglobales bacterium]|nr:hypothetical protein [Terriglobales bacterium]
MTSTPRPGSRLVIVGVLMMALGIIVPSPLEVHFGTGHAMPRPWALTVDGFKACFYVGVALLIIGARRRKIESDGRPRT